MKSEDELKSENALLKLKLELEHGMKMGESSDEPSPQMENEWLKNVYEFEQQFKNAKRITVYDKIGRPVFKKHDELSREEISKEMNRLLDLMGEKEISLDCICEYDDSVIYRFITEELFEHEMDDMNVPGMVCHFTYEEFHPNHDYDLRRHSKDFVEKLLGKKWNDEFDAYVLNTSVLFAGKEYDRPGISSIIAAFREAHSGFKIKELNIEQVNFNLEQKHADVQIQLTYVAKMPDGNKEVRTGKCPLGFVMDEWDYWSISSFQLPGFAT